jgi:D-glycero-D-manno-heptose 1,7-bisphosphate phosphatase
MKRAAFLDRDGVINQKAPEGQYVTCCEQFQFIPGVQEAIALLSRAGYSVIVVSNQRCVAKGLLAADKLQSMHDWMCRELANVGAPITAVYCCPHEEHPPCNCRKPAPGMLLTAACAHGIDLTASWMIGDSDIDIQAGKSAGCQTARILSNDEVTKSAADVLAPSLLSAVHKILQLDLSILSRARELIDARRRDYLY